VVTLTDTVLMVLNGQRGQWEVPGGMRERGETTRQAAARELAEKTGIWTTDLDFAAVVEFDLRQPTRREYAAVYRAELHLGPRLVVNEEVPGLRWWDPHGTVALCGVGAGESVNRGWSDRHDEFVEGSPDP
jgi:8-oxo-dGTP diphosphatase